MRRWQAAFFGLPLLLLSLNSEAGVASLRFCGADPKLDLADQDRLLRVSATVKQLLDGSGQSIALVARSGLNLQRVGLRYSHAGFSLRDNPRGAWAVRQLYFACEEGRSQLFDQGLGGFLAGSSSPKLGYLSVVLLPPEAAQSLEATALDTERAQTVLSPNYSANSYPFDQRYQNCNQWVAELMAIAWSGQVPSDDTRLHAQAWLRQQGYDPAPLQLGSRLVMWGLNALLPWMSLRDHPREDRALAQIRTSVPEALQTWLQQRYPSAQRLEVCHTPAHIVVRQGWVPIADGCVPAEGDRVIPLDDSIEAH